ncbi:MAG TPA: hypothetical protein VF815_44585 [Myxococcaceae bacterium]|jgi:hypothetical protein
MATRAKKSAARKSTARKPAARKSAAKKPAAKKPASRKPASKKPASKKSASRNLFAEGRLAMSTVLKPDSSQQKQKPKSNYCEDHGRLLRPDRTCPISTCRYHTQPMPG